MKKCMMNLFIMFILMFCVASTRATTIGYWRFEDSGASQNNSPALDLTLGSGAGYSSSVPDIRVSDGIEGAISTNTGCYSAGTGSAILNNVSLMNSNMELSSHGFTLEAFIYLPSGVGVAYDGIMTGGSGTGRWYLSIGATGKLTFSGYNGSNGAAFTYASDSVISRDAWHHVAITGEYRENAGSLPYSVVWMYVDYVKGSAAQILNAGSVGGPCLRTSPNPYTVGNYNSNPFFLDEVRASDVVLTTDQFLRAVPEPATVTILGIGLLAVLRRRHA